MKFFEKFFKHSLSHSEITSLVTLCCGAAFLVAVAVIFSEPSFLPNSVSQRIESIQKLVEQDSSTSLSASLYYSKAYRGINVFSNAVYGGSKSWNIFDPEYLKTVGMDATDIANGTTARPAPPACVVGVGSGSHDYTCTNVAGYDAYRIFGSASLYEAANPTNGYTQYFTAKSVGDRYTTIWSTPVGITPYYYAKDTNYTVWRTPGPFSGPYPLALQSVPSFNQNWTLATFTSPNVSTINVAAGTQLTFEWGCQDYQINDFTQTGALGLADYWVIHIIPLFNQGIVRNLTTGATYSTALNGTYVNASGFKPYVTTTYTLQCNSTASSGSYTEPITTCDEFGVCQGGQTYNYTIAAKPGPVLTLKATAVQFSATYGSISPATQTITLNGTGAQKATLNWDADWAYECIVRKEAIPPGVYVAANDVVHSFGSDCNAGGSLQVGPPGSSGGFTTPNTYTYTLYTRGYINGVMQGWATKTATVTVLPQPPAVSVTAPDATAVEGASPADNGTMRITRSVVSASDFTVNFSLTGTGVRNSDYSLSGGSITGGTSGTVVIPANMASVDVTVAPRTDNATFEGSKTAIMTIDAGSGYTLGGSPATVTIVDDEDTTPTITITATDNAAAEAPLDTGTLVVSRGIAFPTPLIINFTRSGSATFGSDYNLGGLTTSVTIPASAASATITLTPIDDPTYEGTERATLTLVAGSGYVVGAPLSDDVDIAEDDPMPPPPTPDVPTIGTFYGDRVRKGAQSTLHWNITGLVDGTTCSISPNPATGTGSLSISTEGAGTTQTAPINQATRYTLTCTNNEDLRSVSTTVTILPSFQEI